MNPTSLVALLAVVILSVACDRNKPVPTIPETKTNFQRTIFTQPESGSTITLVSETECEIDRGGGILLAEYSRQEDRLRVVIRALGTPTVNYFQLLSDGLRIPDSGEVFLLPAALTKYHQQRQAEREAEAARQRAAQEAEAARIRAAKAEEEQRKIDHEKGLAAAGHTFRPPGYCTRCGAAKDSLSSTGQKCVKATGHTFSDTGSCTRCGWTREYLTRENKKCFD